MNKITLFICCLLFYLQQAHGHSASQWIWHYWEMNSGILVCLSIRVERSHSQNLEERMFYYTSPGGTMIQTGGAISVRTSILIWLKNMRNEISRSYLTWKL